MATLRGVLEWSAGAIGALVAVCFMLVMTGGGIYRTTCDLPNGIRTTSWSVEFLPYFSPAPDGCARHTLTRYVAGKTGVMEDVAK